MSSDNFLSEDKTELCLDEAGRMLHISMRKCAELLREGVLPCTSTGKKTRQYPYGEDIPEAFRIHSAGIVEKAAEIFEGMNG